MAIFKCKMCGGSLELNAACNVATCESCGSVQTLPGSTDDVIANLFNRANNLRLKCEFDKAAEVYERILNSDNSDAEAHWGLVLCKYGIEYVEDPNTGKRIPTCHRTQYESVLSDLDCLSALANSDGASKEVYKAQAAEIANLQKDILAIVKNEKPFDVFICYKETDKNGRRTVDSALANDIYYQLTQEGLKVFYAAITLEDKLGIEYEPYIFAALNSAKVMLVVGTKPEYFESVWVRNEWSRYLKLIKADRTKLLIPCYRDMDAYDLPDEFSHLQAQDMSKIGFVNDVVRGIRKIITPDVPKAEKETVIVNQSATGNADALLKRAFMALEDGEFARADDFCEQVLNIDAENAEAYLGKLMIELKAKKRESLAECNLPFDNKANYQKVMRFADENLKSELEGYIGTIVNRNLEAIYSEAVGVMNTAKSEESFKSAAGMFRSISDYKDSAELVEKCLEYAEATRLESVYTKAVYTMKTATNEDNFKVAAGMFRSISDYRDSAVLAKDCFGYAEVARRDKILSLAKANMRGNNITTYLSVINQLECIRGWKNADELISQANQKIEEIKEIEEKYRVELELKKAAEEKRIKKIKKITVIAAAAVVAVTALVLLIMMFVMPWFKYSKAVKLEESGKTAEAAMAFGEIVSFGDSRERSFALWDEIAQRETVSAGGVHTVGLKSDGTVVAVGDNGNGQCKVGDWTDIVAISAGDYHTVGLKSDGTVVAVGSDDYGQCKVGDWTDIVAVSAGDYHTVGLKSDGTVVAVGSDYNGKCKVGDWKDIVSVSAGEDHTVGVKSDGTVVAVGYNEYGQCEVGGWTDIVAVSAGSWHTVGLKSDGTVVAVGSDGYGQCDVDDWKDIVAVSTGDYHTIGLKSDGTVVSVGYNRYGQSNVSDWKDIIAVSAGGGCTLGLKSDGTVVAVGWNYDGQCNLSDWKNIKLPNNK